MLRTLTRHTVQSTLVPHLNARSPRQPGAKSKVPRGFSGHQLQAFMKRGLVCSALAVAGAFALAQSAYATSSTDDEGWMYLPEVSTEASTEVSLETLLDALLENDQLDLNKIDKDPELI